MTASARYHRVNRMSPASDPSKFFGFSCAQPDCSGVVWFPMPPVVDHDSWHRVTLTSACDRCNTAYTWTANVKGPRSGLTQTSSTTAYIEQDSLGLFLGNQAVPPPREPVRHPKPWQRGRWWDQHSARRN